MATTEKSQKDRLIDLTARLNQPMTDTIIDLITRLNKDGKLSKYGKRYSTNIINNILAGRTEDDNFEIYLTEYVAEKEGKKKQVRAHLDAAQAILLG